MMDYQKSRSAIHSYAYVNHVLSTWPFLIYLNSTTMPTGRGRKNLASKCTDLKPKKILNKNVKPENNKTQHKNLILPPSFHIAMPCLKVRCLRLLKPTLNFSKTQETSQQTKRVLLTFRSAYNYLFTSRMVLSIDAEDGP